MNQYNSAVEALKHSDEMDNLHSRMPIAVQLFIDIFLAKAPVLGALQDRVRSTLARNAKERWEDYFDALRNDIESTLRDQNKKIKEFLEKSDGDRLPSILIEGMRRSEQAATREKARRLGNVAASGIVRHPEDSLDKVTEFLRFAEELSETDILVLREMQKAQAQCNPDRFQSARADDVRKVMNIFQVTQSDGKILDYAYVKSSFARLQSLGLAIQLSSQSNTSPEKLPFELLRLGNEFLEYIGSAAP